MGFEVAAIARGADKAELAKKLGAHHFIDSSATDPAAALQALGGAKVILVTAAGGKTVAATFKGLRPGGVSIVLGVGPEPIEVSSMHLIFGTRRLDGALTGAPAVGDATLRFSALTGVAAMIETVPLEEAAAAYAKMMAGKARFRMVLTMDHVMVTQQLEGNPTIGRGTIMNSPSLAELAIEAHGGLDRWRRFKTVSARLLNGGALWPLKHQGGVLDDVRRPR